MEQSFAELLKKRNDEVEKPKAMPSGTYYGVITNFELVKSSKKGTPGVEFKLRLSSPGEDVDPELFENAGGMEKLQKKELRHTFWLSAESLFRLTGFLDLFLGEDDNRPQDERLPDMRNKACVVTLTVRPAQDPSDDSTYNDVSDCRPAED